MALVVNSNIASLNAQRNLNKSQSSLNTSLQRLSSGLRINSAKDDAAGLYVSEQFTRDIRGSNQAGRNAADGISLGQTAEGALGEISNNLQRIREIAIQASNATVSSDAAKGLQKEVDQLTAEITRVVKTTNFNGTSLLSGGSDSDDLNFQIGAGSGDQIAISLSNASLTGLSMLKAAAGSDGVDGVVAGLTNTGGTVTGGTASGGTVTAPTGVTLGISGGTISGGSLSAGTLNAGTLSGGTVGSTTGDSGTYVAGTGTFILTAGGNTLTDLTDDVYKIVGATVTGATFTGVDVSGATVTGGTVKGGTVSGASVTGGTVTGATVTDGTTSGGTTIDDKGNIVAGATISSGTTTGGTTTGGTVTDATISGTDTKVEGATTSGGAVTGASFSGATLTGVTITGVKLSSIDKDAGGNVIGGTVGTMGTTAIVDGDTTISTATLGSTGGELTAGVGTTAVGSATVTGGVITAGTTSGNISTSGTGTTTIGSATHLVDISNPELAKAALSKLSDDINTVSSARATFGAVQNRFESVISNLQNYSENLSAARSRVQDADFAAETASLTRAQILQQAGVSVLAQANSAPQAALSLLQ